MSKVPPIRSITIAALCCVVLAACSTTADRKKDKNSLNRQGFQALAVLTHYLFPAGWNEDIGVAVARRMLPLEYHGNVRDGKTLIQSKVEMDPGALQRLLSDVQQVTPTFTNIVDLEHSFGKNSHLAFDEKGAKQALSWWKPGSQKEPDYFFWSKRPSDDTETRIWLQVTDGKKRTKIVYVRIESGTPQAPGVVPEAATGSAPAAPE